MLKKIKIKDEKSKAKELRLYNFGAKVSGLIDLNEDPKNVMELLKPKHFEYEMRFK